MAQYKRVASLTVWVFMVGWMGFCAIPEAMAMEGSELFSGNLHGRGGASVGEMEPDPVTVTRVYVYADESDLQRLFRRDPRSDDRISGFVRFDSPRSRARALNGFRFRGNTSRYHLRKSYNIRFTRARSELLGSDRLNLNAMYTDPSGVREKLAWEMFARVAYPAPEARYMALYMNEVYEGLGVHVQRVDEVLLRHHGLPSGGTLVRDMTRRRGEAFGIDRRSVFGLNLAQHDDVPSLLAGLFETRGRADWQELARLIRWVHDTPPGTDFARGFEERFDLERFVDWLALHYLTGDVDAFGDDYWLYRAPGRDGRWILIPWDKDITFGHNEREGLEPEPELGRTGKGLVQLNDYFAYEYPLDDAGWDNELIVRFMQTPGLREHLFDRLIELMDDVFTLEWTSAQIARQRDAIAPYMPPLQTDVAGAGAFRYHTRQHHGSEGHFEDHVAAVLDFVELRHAYIRREIARQTRETETREEALRADRVPNVYDAAVQIRGTQRLLLTDDHGWTLASIEPIQPMDPCSLRIESKSLAEGFVGGPEQMHKNVTEGAAEFWQEASVDSAAERQAVAAYDGYTLGIMREWAIHTDCVSFESQLSLYYRNDIAPDGKENWYSQRSAVGRQQELLLAVRRAGEGVSIHAITVNPFSNKATASIEIKDGDRLLLVLPQ